MCSELMESRRLRTEAAAAYLGVSSSWLEKARLRSDGPIFSKIGRAVVYDTDNLDRWLRENERRSTSDPGKAAL